MCLKQSFSHSKWVSEIYDSYFDRGHGTP